MKYNKLAVVLAGGKGTRMNSDRPKVVHELNGKPLICYVIDHLLSAGYRLSEIVIVVGYKEEEVRKVCSNYPGIHFVKQESQLGTAHALLSARKFLENFNGEILVACGDVPMISTRTFQKLFEYHTNSGFRATLLSANVEKPFGYGRIIRDKTGDVVAIVEEKDATDTEKRISEINTGTYIFSSNGLLDGLQSINNQNNQNEYYLPDIIKNYHNQKLRIGALLIDNSYEWQGINRVEDISNLEFLLKEQVVV